MAASAVSAATTGATAATWLGRSRRRGLGGRALRVGSRNAHADAVDARTDTRAVLARRRGGSSASHEGGIPGVPQAPGAAASLTGAAGATAATVSAVSAVAAVPAVATIAAGRAGSLARRAGRDRLLTAYSLRTACSRLVA